LTTATETIRVELGTRSYDIEIGCGILPSLPAQLARRLRVQHAVIITDSNVQSFYGQAVQDALRAHGARAELLTIPAGELSKSVERAQGLWQALLDGGADRQTLVVAVGGGVVGDLAGFVAATYARGLRFVQVPTSLLAQVDSSVGGKVGVNLPTAKNMVGCFWQPRYVSIDIDTLETLPDGEYTAGLAEVVKYGAIRDEQFFALLERHADAIRGREKGVLQRIVARCCQIKAEIVAADEREESGLRAILNYGHTFAHALEVTCGYGQLRHGEAVALGMQCAARLARLLGLFNQDSLMRQVQLCDSLGLPTRLPPVDFDRLWSAMMRDKKAQQGTRRFLLPLRLGHVEFVEGLDRETVRSAVMEVQGGQRPDRPLC
jgi:3-dehydroquinate synthase